MKLNIYIKLMILSFSAVLLCISSGCAHSPKATPESERNPSQKMTPPNDENQKLRLGLSVKFDNLEKVEAEKLAREFKAQIAAFEPCMTQTGKSEVVRVKAHIQLEKNGTITKVEIQEVVPASEVFSQCFLKQIAQLDLGKRGNTIGATLQIGTYYGSPHGWGGKVAPHK